MSLILDGTSGITTPGPVNGAATMLSPITNSLSSDVLLNNTANYFDGPSVAQGTSGTWFASGTVTLLDQSSQASYFVKLWDGTTVIASTRMTSVATGEQCAISLSGFITSPAANLRISVRDASSTGGKIVYGVTYGSGNTKDSTITAIRIG